MAFIPTTTLIVFVAATLSQCGGQSTTPVTSDPPPETFPPPTTIPPGCTRYDGTEVEDLLPGDSRQLGCEYCECDWEGLAVCYYADCIMPRCVDPEQGECCSTCPNGSNCMTPFGRIIGDGETVTEDGMVCTCNLEDYYFWEYETAGDGPQADCTMLTTTPPTPACLLDNGTAMAELHPQGHWRSADGCVSCYCEVSGRARCNVTECSVPACVHPVSTPGVCCGGCPEGNNCVTPAGTIIEDGQHFVEGNMNCSCDVLQFINDGGENTTGNETGTGNGTGSGTGGMGTGPRAVCSFLPSGCRFSNGTVMEGVTPGKQVQADSCTSCTCSDDWRMTCAVRRCEPPSCADVVIPEGGCCPECSDGADDQPDPVKDNSESVDNAGVASSPLGAFTVFAFGVYSVAVTALRST